MITPLHETGIANTGLLPALVTDYLLNKPELKHLFKYPLSLSAFRQVIADKAKDNTNRQLLVKVLKAQYAQFENAEAVSNNIDLLLQPNTFTITASHQPCLFLGPLYNVFKISSAINLAQQLKHQYPENNFVPVFWLGSEDHDIEELSHVYVKNNRVEWKDAGTGAVGRLNTNTLKQAIDEIKALGVSDEIISTLQNGVEQFKAFGTLTQYLTHQLFKGHGLVVLDQDNAELKKSFSAVIKDEVFNRRAIGLLKENLEFLETNYKAQAKPREINFFYLGDGFRERIIYNPASSVFEVNNRNLSFSKVKLELEIEAHPERFSPNVIFRPLYQETILPNLAFIGGAGELSYWLELKPVFEYYKVNYPVLVLRKSAVLVNPSTIKKQEKLGLEWESFLGEVEPLITTYVKDALSPEAHLNGERDKISEVFDSLAEKAALVDVTLKNNVAAEKQKALAALDNIESKILKAEKRKQETAVTQIRAVKEALFPNGELQERREGLLAFYDDSFLNSIVENANPLSNRFTFFAVD